VTEPTPRPTAPNPLEILLALIRRARVAESAAALRFIAVNDSHLLSPFHQSVLWLHGKVETLSGLTEVDANAPYAQWLAQARPHFGGTARVLTAADLPAPLDAEWAQWLPAHALWIPVSPEGDSGLLFARDVPWRDIELRLFVEWLETWFCAYRAQNHPGPFTGLLRLIRRAPRALKRKPLLWAAGILAILLFPVRLSVLVPGELVPANPVAVRAPLEGVIQNILCRTNESVVKGQVLFVYDASIFTSKLEVAQEALRTAEAEERQYSQQALFDQRARGALSTARGNVEEKRIEVDYLKDQLARNQVTAPLDGIAFVGDPSEWIGRPVVAGQRILRIAAPDDREIEAWLPIGDAIRLPENAPVKLYLSASPLSPVAGSLRFVSYDAFRRPDNTYAYRVRARLDGPSDHRVGLKGTVRLSGGRVPFVYWMLRRPLAAAREFFGL
jgi:hypothetical protein